MPAIRTAEVRTIAIAVTDVPDLPNYNGTIAMVPAWVEIEYRWQHPDHRDGWFVPGRASVKVSGPRRLKSGNPGTASMTLDFYATHGRDRPDWLTALVTEHLPPEFTA